MGMPNKLVYFLFQGLAGIYPILSTWCCTVMKLLYVFFLLHILSFDQVSFQLQHVIMHV